MYKGSVVLWEPSGSTNFHTLMLSKKFFGQRLRPLVFARLYPDEIVRLQRHLRWQYCPLFQAGTKVAQRKCLRGGQPHVVNVTISVYSMLRTGATAWHPERLAIYLRTHMGISLRTYSDSHSSSSKSNGDVGSSKPKILKPPKMPDASECCGNGCNDCVWLTYFEEYAAYTEFKKSQTAAGT